MLEDITYVLNYLNFNICARSSSCGANSDLTLYVTFGEDNLYPVLEKCVGVWEPYYFNHPSSLLSHLDYFNE